jgi:hypothetical protein
MHKKSAILALLVPFILACEDSTSPDGAGQVAVRFQAVAAASAPAAGVPITLTGSNGTLVITDIRLIVSEIELERVDGECLNDDDDDCEEFEGGPYLVNLLEQSATDVVRAVVPAGLYTELEFEVEDLDIDDDDDNGERAAKQAILTELRQTYPSFPTDASMVVRGTFDGEPFTVFFEAEIEVEQEFPRPFRVPEDELITVLLDPAAWFMNGTQVIDLLALDGRTIEFEAEFEDGVLEIEFDD